MKQEQINSLACMLGKIKLQTDDYMVRIRELLASEGGFVQGFPKEGC